MAYYFNILNLKMLLITLQKMQLKTVIILFTTLQQINKFVNLSHK